jgi:hypothetical protein
MARDSAEDVRDVLRENRQAALSYADHAGPGRVRELMAFAEQDLMDRIAAVSGVGTFTEANLNTMLRQVRLVTAQLTQQLTGTIVEESEAMSTMAARGTLDYMMQADSVYRGVGVTPLAFDEASVFDNAKMGARSSVLRRLAMSGEGGMPEEPGKMGVMQRYGLNTIGEFEKVLRVGVVTRKGIDQVKGDLTKASPLLQGKPGFWAERIARTEMMGAYNRAGWEAHRDVDEQLGGDEMVRILCATFDDRTAADSYAVHGQIRRPEEAFDTWYGPMQHPPARPNDREIVVPHRIAWEIPDYLKPMAPGMIATRWRFEGRKGSPPPRPLMTTVPLDRFGKEPEKAEGEEEGGGDEELTEEQKAAKEAGLDPFDPAVVEPESPFFATEPPVPEATPEPFNERRTTSPRALAQAGEPALGGFSEAEQSLISDLTSSLLKKDEVAEIEPLPDIKPAIKAAPAKPKSPLVTWAKARAPKR